MNVKSIVSFRILTELGLPSSTGLSLDDKVIFRN